MLLAEGAAIELRDRDGRPALHHAAEHMQEDVARFLLERGADIHARDAQNRKPYQLVPERGGVLCEDTTRRACGSSPTGGSTASPNCPWWCTICCPVDERPKAIAGPGVGAPTIQVLER